MSLGAGLLLGRTSREPQLFLRNGLELLLEEDWKNKERIDQISFLNLCCLYFSKL